MTPSYYGYDEFVYSKTRPATADNKQKSNLHRNKKATERLPLNETMVTYAAVAVLLYMTRFSRIELARFVFNESRVTRWMTQISNRLTNSSTPSAGSDRNDLFRHANPLITYSLSTLIETV
jgi:hypothetical protein